MTSAPITAFLKTYKHQVIIASLLLVGGSVALYLRQPSIKLELVATELLKEKYISVRIDAQVKALREQYLVIRRGGSLDEVKVTAGEQVAEGGIIAVVDAGRHEARLRRALSQFALASAEYARTRKLFASATETRQALDQSTNNLNVARSEVEEAKKDLEDGLIRAPFAGIVSFIAFKLGDYIPDGGRVAVIEDRTGYTLRGRTAKQYRKYFPYKGRVYLQAAKERHKIADAAVTPATEEGFFAEDFDIELRLATLPAAINVGEKVTLEIPVVKMKQVVKLPVAAVDTTATSPRVLTLKDNRLHWENVNVVMTEQSNAYISKPAFTANVVQLLQAVDLAAVIDRKIRPSMAAVKPAAKPAL